MTAQLHLTDGPHVIVDDIESCELLDDDRHHLAKSLRLRDGDPLSVTDGRGRWRTAVFGRLVEPTSEVAATPNPAPPIAIGFALVKSAKPELIVQKLTELGVDRMQPVRTERSVVRWDTAKALKAQERLIRVAREALMQSKGAWLPHVAQVCDFDDLVASGDYRVLRADFDGPLLASKPQLISDDVMFVAGPEGGWSERECEIAPNTVSLGERVLRAETACIALGVLTCTARLGLHRTEPDSD